MKNKQTIALIVGLLCVFLSVFGIFKALNTSVFELPVMGLVEDSTDFEELEDMFKDAKKDLKDKVKAEDVEDETGVDIEDIEEMFETPSLNRLISMGNKLEDFEDEVDSDVDLGESLSLLSAVRIAVIIFGALIALFSLLGALLKKKAFPIIAMILSLGFYLVFVGAIYLALFFVLSIAHIVLLSKSKAM